MAFVIRYIKQSDMDNMEKWSGKRMTAEQIEARKSEVKVATKAGAGAERVVESLRMTGHIATYYEESEL